MTAPITAERLTPPIETKRDFNVALDLYKLALLQHGPVNKLATEDCSICRERRDKVDAIVTELLRQRLQLAKLAACSESPQFFNPLVAFEAQAIRDAVLSSHKPKEESNAGQS
ncbi:MAG: hypothetical protein JWL97_3002 [Gemmatimonadales bacterium]|nr:hypothetical protein [Gemmatimonadales bacterium]